MNIEEWWQVIDMGMLDAKQYIEQGWPNATKAHKMIWYIDCMKARKKQMGEKYTRQEVKKWNNKYHFDETIGVIMTYKD
jgi:hypothetical protein